MADLSPLGPKAEAEIMRSVLEYDERVLTSILRLVKPKCEVGGGENRCTFSTCDCFAADDLVGLVNDAILAAYTRGRDAGRMDVNVK